MLTLQIKEKEIENLTPEEEFIRGTVGAKCQINFDEFWQGYEKYIVFKRIGYEPINIMADSLENEIDIPYTILAESGEFKIGVFGITETETLPTLYSKDIKIRYGTDTHGTTPPTYIPSEIDQLRLSKQDKLVSGENIKTINGESVLGKGDIKVQTKIEADQTFNPTSENAQSGKAVAEAVATVGGQGFGHYETVVEEIWQRNKIFTPVSFDYENQVITVSEGDLDEYSIGDKIFCIIVPNISGCTLNSLGGAQKYFQTLTVLSATELSVSNALHADTTVANFHFESIANYFLIAKNLSAKKIRVTVNGASSVPNTIYNKSIFFGITADDFYTSTVGYTHNSIPLRSSMRLETEIISPYTLFSQISIGYNCASSDPNYRWKNNGAAWVGSADNLSLTYKHLVFNSDGTKIENLWRTTVPWHCNENGQAKNDNPYGSTTLHICNGTYLKIERWVE